MRMAVRTTPISVGRTETDRSRELDCAPMRLERERSDGRRDFWEAKVSKTSLETTTGIVNVRNKKTSKHFSSPKDAKAALQKAEAAKRKAGFTEPVVIGAQFLPTPMPTNGALEDAIREAKHEAGPCSVYADWLQSQDSPAGELVALAAALETKQDAKKQKRFDELARQLALPTPDFATWGFRHGFWQWLRLENGKDWMDDKFDPLAFATKLFATPLCAALDELRIGILRWDHNSHDVPAVLEAAGDCRWSKALARLHLGDVDGNIDMAHHVIGDVGQTITKAFPALRSLKLHSGSQEWRGVGETFGLAGLALPKLESLTIETCAMTKARLDAVLGAKLPALTQLELWFGGSDRDAGAQAADLAPLLDGKVFSKVTRLGLRNLDFMGDLIEQLVASKIAPRLVHLDLSMGTLDDDWVAHLGANADRFRSLKVLDVDDNFLRPRDLRELRSSFTKAQVLSKKQDKLEDAEDDDRFVSVHE